MKPNFALSLSFEGIGLLHRTSAGWHTVGDVQLDDNLADALAALRETALAIDPSGLRSKLVVPNDQIKFLSFESDSRDIDILEAQVRNMLDGATPYALTDLAYDWSMRDGIVHVAAVAIETLTEAETFAIDHEFGPMSFVAIPEDGTFEGEPFFGETVYAGQVLGPDDSVERDDFAIKVVGAIRLPDPEPEPEPAPVVEEPPVAAEPAPVEPEPTPDPVQTVEAAEPTPTPEVPEPVTTVPEPEPAAEPPAPEAPVADEITDEPVATVPELDFDQPLLPFDVTEPTPPTPAEDTPAQRPPSPAVQAMAPPEADTVAPKADPKPEAPKAPEATVSFSSYRSRPAPEVETPATPDAPATPAPAAKVAPPAPAAPTPPKDSAGPSISLTSATPTTVPPPVRPTAKPAAPSSKHPGRMSFMSRRKSKAAEGATPSAPRTKPSMPKIDWGKRASGAASIATGIGAGIGAGLTKGFGKARDAASNAAAYARSRAAKQDAQETAAMRTAAQAIQDEKQRMTVFGARTPDPAVADRSRYTALTLTAALLFFLVAIAAWAAIFLDDGVAGLFRSNDDRRFVEQPDGSEDVASLPDTAVIETEPELEVPAPEPENPVEAAISEALSEDEARARYAATGIWQMAPTPTLAPEPVTREDVYQTALDPSVSTPDLSSIPTEDQLQYAARPRTPANPPPAGVVIPRDDRGFIAATPDGFVTPEGFTLFSGEPPVKPNRYPDRPDTQLAETAPEPPAPASDQLRPRLRPEGLTDGAEQTEVEAEDTDVAGLSDTRPRTRPASIQAAAEAAIQAALQEAVEAEPEAEPEAEEVDPLAGATPQAVGQSLKPRPRPRRFAAIVRRAQQAQEEEVEAAAAEPVSNDQRVNVSIPSTASVARAATERNQISLRKVNLIGVYGSPSSRRALVRLASGRYKKVSVGDRLDGGQVAAIGEDELRYIKKGKSVVLKMPKG